MVGRVIRKLGSFVYDYPKVSEDAQRTGRFGRLKIALVTDYFTADCLSAECRVRVMTPANYRDVIGNWKPDFVLAESAFHGVDGSWRYELAKQPKMLRLTKPKAIFSLVEYAKQAGVPTVFWNKDDGPFFEAFIDVAKAFEYVFTTDEECLDRYRQHVPEQVRVDTLVMPFQPAFHSFTGFNFTRNEVCFTGSYYRRILNERRRFLDMVFEICERNELPLNVFDRNHDRLSHRFEFRFPTSSQVRLHGKVAHRKTASIYKSHLVSINVNSVTSSETMFSRRLLEILACGGIAVTNPSRAVDRHFRNFCHVVNSYDETRDLFARLRHGPSQEDLDRAEAGAKYVRENHTWAHRLEQICAVVKI
ncbi:CgeB family protein [Paraburkholderia lycopersici]|uniref:Spore maturation protein CgeB n=1 Tax=Paraburkholderia lycopersici TaxID=416944 RepID=A0A1G6NJL2_9BURK|nr:glycosyltransferase [Paraburkholderia lycopersici]SDC67554.1 Spore maturation protein CgeB [Paraburkholderia lycopersici]